MSGESDIQDQVRQLVNSSDVLLFMKGTRDAPECGFSASLVRILDALLPEYATFNVLADPGLRQGVKEFSSWPTIPQLYVKGEFVGGCDIVQEMSASGELEGVLGLELDEAAATPTVTVSPGAAEGLRRALSQTADQGELHVSVDARFHNQLFMAPAAPGEISVESNGVTLWMDRLTAQRIDGASIDIVDSPQGLSFRIDNPNTLSDDASPEG